MLNTLLDALGEFDDPQVYKATVDIAQNDEFPVPIRAKAIRALGRFADDATVKMVLPVLANADNYPLRPAMMDMLQTMGKTDVFAEDIRRLAFKAQQEALNQ
jgi:HEAT repeat protein